MCLLVSELRKGSVPVLIVSYKKITESTLTLSIQSTSDPGKGQCFCEISYLHTKLQHKLFHVEYQSSLDLKKKVFQSLAALLCETLVLTNT